MVDTGTIVSLIQPGISRAQVQPCDVQARGITGIQVDILGEQKVRFVLQSDRGKKVFEHTLVVSPLGRCSSGTLGMDFLQRVGAGISLTFPVPQNTPPFFSIEGSGASRCSAPDQR